jgi:hypothetical protein
MRQKRFPLFLSGEHFCTVFGKISLSLAIFSFKVEHINALLKAFLICMIGLEDSLLRGKDKNITMYLPEMREFVLFSRRREISLLYSNHYCSM